MDTASAAPALDSIPLRERLSSRNAKHRAHGYAEILDTISSGTTDLDSLLEGFDVEQAMTENSPVILLKGMQLSLHYLNSEPEEAECAKIATAVFVKALGGRPNVRQIAIQVIDTLIEQKGAAFFLAHLVPQLTHRQPRIVQNAAEALQHMAESSKLVTADLDVLYQNNALKSACEHKTKGARNAAIVAATSLCALDPSLDDHIALRKPLMPKTDKAQSSAPKTQPKSSVAVPAAPPQKQVARKRKPHRPSSSPDEASVQAEAKPTSCSSGPVSVMAELNIRMRDVEATAWKQRANAWNSAFELLERTPAILPDFNSDLIRIIERRLKTESVHQCVINILKFLASFSRKSAEFDSWGKAVKSFASEAFAFLGDMKSSIRDAAFEVAETWLLSPAIGIRRVGSSLLALFRDSPSAQSHLQVFKLIKDNPEVFDWTKTKLTNSFIPVVLQRLQDGDASVRRASEVLLTSMVEAGARSLIQKKVNRLDKASQAMVAAAIRRAFQAEPTITAAPEPAIKSEESAPTHALRSTKAPIDEPSLPEPPEDEDVTATLRDHNEEGILTCPASQKELRFTKERRIRWVSEFNEVLPESFRVFRAQVQLYATGDLKKNLTKATRGDHPAALAAVSRLAELLNEHPPSEGLYNCSDIIFKFFSVVLMLNTPSLLRDSFPLIENLFGMFSDKEESLSNWEASLFVPILVERLGSSKSFIVKEIRSLLNKLCLIYPPSRVFQYVSNGIHSRSNRTRQEVLSMATDLIRQHGRSVISSAKVVTPILKLADDHVTAKAVHEFLITALHAFGSVEELIAVCPAASSFDHVFSTVSLRQEAEPACATPLQSEQKQQVPSSITSTRRKPLMKKLQHLQIPSLTPARDLPGFEAPQDTMGEARQMGGETPLLPSKSRVIAYGTTSKLAHLSRHVIQSSPDESLRLIIAGLGDSNDEAAIDALKALQVLAGEHLMTIIDYADEITNRLSLQIQSVFTDPDSNSRLCKHLLNTTHILFSPQGEEAVFATVVGIDPLSRLFSTLLGALIDTNLHKATKGAVYVNAFNNVVLLLLQFCDISTVLCALIRVLREAFMDSKQQPDDTYIDVVTRCISKLLPSISTSDDLSVGVVLRDLNLFLFSYKYQSISHERVDTVVSSICAKIIQHLVSRNDSIDNHLHQVPIRSQGARHLVLVLNEALVEAGQNPIIPSAIQAAKAVSQDSDPLSSSNPLRMEPRGLSSLDLKVDRIDSESAIQEDSLPRDPFSEMANSSITSVDSFLQKLSEIRKSTMEITEQLSANLELRSLSGTGARHELATLAAGMSSDTELPEATIASATPESSVFMLDQTERHERLKVLQERMASLSSPAPRQELPQKTHETPERIRRLKQRLHALHHEPL